MHDIEAKKLLNSCNWTIANKKNSFAVKLPPNLIHDAGEYPIKIYWAYNNELSKSIGLDFSKFLGTEVRIEIYNLNEPFSEERKFRILAFGVIVGKSERIVGAYIHRGRHSSFAYSLDRKRLEEVTNKDWNEWIDAYINYENPIETMLSNMSQEEIISTYYNARDKGDRRLAMACLTRKYLCGALSSNMDNSYLYNEDFPDNNIRSARLIDIREYIYPVPQDPPGVITYEVKVDMDFVKEITARDGIVTWFDR
jgi:hypothetical protein